MSATRLRRREFVGSLAAAVGVSALISGCRSAVPASGMAVGKPYRVDVHHHFAPPAWNAALASRRITVPAVGEWSPARSIEDMDKSGVATSVVSITYPGVSLGDVDFGRRLARECNEYGARLVGDFPGRFGLWAALPLADVDGSLREIEYALDVLRADGIGLLTNVGDKWLGDTTLAPVMEELNRRKTVVYTHPTTAHCCRNLLTGVPDAIIEWGTDTSRAIASVLFSGTASRLTNLRFIFSHGGGTTPFLIERFTRLPLANKEFAARMPNGVLFELRKFFYDCAQVANPMALASLTKLVPASHILFGTDFPFRVAADHVKGLGEFGFSAADLRAIERENAVGLVPRLAAWDRRVAIAAGQLAPLAQPDLR